MSPLGKARDTVYLLLCNFLWIYNYLEIKRLKKKKADVYNSTIRLLQERIGTKACILNTLEWQPMGERVGGRVERTKGNEQLHSSRDPEQTFRDKCCELRRWLTQASLHLRSRARKEWGWGEGGSITLQIAPSFHPLKIFPFFLEEGWRRRWVRKRGQEGGMAKGGEGKRKDGEERGGGEVVHSILFRKALAWSGDRMGPGCLGPWSSEPLGNLDFRSSSEQPVISKTDVLCVRELRSIECWRSPCPHPQHYLEGGANKTIARLCRPFAQLKCLLSTIKQYVLLLVGWQWGGRKNTGNKRK